MFITHKENIIDEDLINIYSSIFTDSDDVISCKRNIIIHEDVIHDQAKIEGHYTIKCTIINSAVLSGVSSIGALVNPNVVLVKTMYHGVFNVPLMELEGKSHVTDDVLCNKVFHLNVAYTSMMGVWDSIRNMEHFSTVGFSILDMYNLRNTLLLRNIPVYIRSDDDPSSVTMTVDVSFDGVTYNRVLPLPPPQYYSRRHSRINGDNDVITQPLEVPFQELCDSHTKVSRTVRRSWDDDLSKTNFRYGGVDSSTIRYFGKDDVQLFNIGDVLMPLNIAVSELPKLADALFTAIFAMFSKYMVSELLFVYKSSKKIFEIKTLRFSYDHAPEGYGKTLSMEMENSDAIEDALKGFSVFYGRVGLICRITDLEFNLRTVHYTPVKGRPDLNYTHYNKTMCDMVSTNFDDITTIHHPIGMMT